MVLLLTVVWSSILQMWKAQTRMPVFSQHLIILLSSLPLPQSEFLLGFRAQGRIPHPADRASVSHQCNCYTGAAEKKSKIKLEMSTSVKKGGDLWEEIHFPASCFANTPTNRPALAISKILTALSLSEKWFRSSSLFSGSNLSLRLFQSHRISGELGH